MACWPCPRTGISSGTRSCASPSSPGVAHSGLDRMAMVGKRLWDLEGAAGGAGRRHPRDPAGAPGLPEPGTAVGASARGGALDLAKCSNRRSRSPDPKAAFSRGCRESRATWAGGATRDCAVGSAKYRRRHRPACQPQPPDQRARRHRRSVSRGTGHVHAGFASTSITSRRNQRRMAHDTGDLLSR